MNQTTALRDNARAWSAQVRSADVSVGIPSYKKAAMTGHVVSVAGEGLDRYFVGEARHWQLLSHDLCDRGDVRGKSMCGGR
jgi:hypothetical protein